MIECRLTRDKSAKKRLSDTRSGMHTKMHQKCSLCDSYHSLGHWYWFHRMKQATLIKIVYEIKSRLNCLGQHTVDAIQSFSLLHTQYIQALQHFVVRLTLHEYLEQILLFPEWPRWEFLVVQLCSWFEENKCARTALVQQQIGTKDDVNVTNENW